MLAISCIKAHGTQCSEENAGKYDRNDDTRLYCSTSRGSAARDKRCQYESTWHTVFGGETLENMTEMTILVCIAVQAVVPLRVTNAASMKAHGTQCSEEKRWKI